MPDVVSPERLIRWENRQGAQKAVRAQEVAAACQRRLFTSEMDLVFDSPWEDEDDQLRVDGFIMC